MPEPEILMELLIFTSTPYLAKTIHSLKTLMAIYPVENYLPKLLTLDSYYEKASHLPDFVKIDVEGYEWNVLQGFKKIIAKYHPKLMVEIQNDAENILTFFKNYDYTIYNDKLEEIIDYNDYLNKKTPNIFFQYYN